MRGFVIALAVTYLLLAHLAVLTGSTRLTLACPAALLALALCPALARRKAGSAGTPPAGACAIAVLSAAAALVLAFGAAPDWKWLLLYAPPVLGDAFLAWLFGHTLADGEVPLIERMVRLLHAPAESLDAAVVRYTRSLTAAWAMLFAALGLVDLLLALVARPNGVLALLGIVPGITVPQRAWSWFANIAEYLIVAGFFFLEYAYRRRRFPGQTYAGFLDFARRLSAVAPHVLAGTPPRGAPSVSEQT